MLQQVAVEIRYARGMVYLDRCGSLFEKMSETLGAAFTQQGLPTVEHTVFKSPIELLSLNYGPSNLVVTQRWTTNPARVEQLAAKAWTIISDALQVRSHVRRAGIRFMTQWPTESRAEAQDILSRAVPPPQMWSSIFGKGGTATYISIQSDVNDGAATRTELSYARNIPVGVPDDLRGRVPDHAVQLDVDYVYPGCASPFEAGGTDRTQPIEVEPLRRFMRTSWESMQRATAEFSKEVGL